MTYNKELNRGTPRAPVLPFMEQAFCDYFIATGLKRQSAIDAGYSGDEAQDKATYLLRKADVKEYIAYQRRQLQRSTIADGIERREFLTRVMRGEEIASIVTRDGVVQEEPDHMAKIKAAMELAKMDGDYAPVKIDIRLTEYNREWLRQVFTVLSQYLTPEKLKEAAKALPRYDP